MYPKEISKYVAELYSRLSEATIVMRVQIREGNWQPQPKKCHENVETFCKLHKDYRPVRGWLIFDLGGHSDHVKFLQHSVVMSPDGQLIDITPSIAAQYPFLRAEESDEDFFEKENHTDDYGNLIYFLNGA